MPLSHEVKDTAVESAGNPRLLPIAGVVIQMLDLEILAFPNRPRILI